MFQPVSQKSDFPALERDVLAFWKKEQIFEKSMAQRKGKPRFVFYEGPPTANGTPHNGHVLTRVIKDLFPRYKTMRGYEVPRKAGWDTHGLPVEVEVEKELGIHGKADIEAYGVEAFTRKCIESVFRYTDVWQQLTERIGFWVDLDAAYVTYHKSFVESVWWALGTLFERGLLYQGHKVVWWWPQGGTALSSGEVGLGYKTVDDPSVIVRFRLIAAENTSFLGWTTTPWTLPSNCALAVSPTLDYVFAQKDDETVIVAAALADTVLGEGTYVVQKTVKGAELVGLRYKPVFDYAKPATGRVHEVIGGDFVTATAGTGVVHTAPAFGEDDFRVAKESGIGMLQLVGPDGRFLPEVTDFAGRFCKEADRDIIKKLRSLGLLFKEEVYRHDYPFCWRADSDPLIQYARPAWFIRTTDVVSDAIATNQTINWLPNHIKDGRFGDFLRNNVDWALSRERYWGTPLPIWTCNACATRWVAKSATEIEVKNPGAFEAFRKAQQADPSLSEHLMVHKPWIDDVTVPCASCNGTMRRVTEVIDCWFDSGCMPFAQWGYPHQNKESFEASFPADFISEAIDQTRGWFYSLLMVSTLLFGEKARASAPPGAAMPATAGEPHPYKTCIVLGHVTDKTGKKESKSKGNYTPPDLILNTSGADAMRWYFYAANPPYANTRYSPEAVREKQQEFLLKLHNVYSFFVIYSNIDGFDPKASPKRPLADRALLDRWISSELALTVRAVTAHMDEYLIYDAALRITAFTDGLSNWYVRRSRDRFWGSGGTDDKWDAYHTLYEVLTTFSSLIAPFVPFMADSIYRNLVSSIDPTAPMSVHLTDFPTADLAAIDERLSDEMQTVRDIVSLGLSTRNAHKLKVRQPLRQAEVILARPALKAQLAAYESLITDELNVKTLLYSNDAGGRVSFGVKPNYKELGPRFGKRMPLVRAAVDAAEPNALRLALTTQGEVPLRLSDGDTVTLTADLVELSCQAAEGYAASGAAVGTVILDTRLDDELIGEGWAREVTSRVQGLRKERELPFVARIRLQIEASGPALAALKIHEAALASETLATEVSYGPVDGRLRFELDGHTVAVEFEVV